MKIDDITIGDAKLLASLFGSAGQNSVGCCSMIGEKVIVRTYSAGVFFGFLKEKSGNEVILQGCRRLWQWQAKESISLSAVALYGIDATRSRIAPALPLHWCEAIEIIPCTDAAIRSIEGAPNAEAK